MTALTWVPIFVTLTSGCSNRDPHRHDARHHAHTTASNRSARRPRRQHASQHVSSIFSKGAGRVAVIGTPTATHALVEGRSGRRGTAPTGLSARGRTSLMNTHKGGGRCQ